VTLCVSDHIGSHFILHRIDCSAFVNQHVTLETLGTGGQGKREKCGAGISVWCFSEIILKLNACLLPANLERLSKMLFLARSSGRGNMMVLKVTLP